METAEAKDKLKQLVTGLAEDLKPEVVKIEKKFATTKNRYGDYMALISAVAKDERTAKLIVLALIEAGANREGVTDAMRIIYPQ